MALGAVKPHCGCGKATGECWGGELPAQAVQHAASDATCFISRIFKAQLNFKKTSNKVHVLIWIPFSKSKTQYEHLTHSFYCRHFSTGNSKAPLKTFLPALVSSVCFLKPAHQVSSGASGSSF